MLCTGSGCGRATKCALYYMNPQPECRKYDNIENLSTFGWGSADGSGEWYCGSLGNYKMFEPIPDQMLYEMIANQINSLGFGITVAPENIKSFIEQFKEHPNE